VTTGYAEVSELILNAWRNKQFAYRNEFARVSLLIALIVTRLFELSSMGIRELTESSQQADFISDENTYLLVVPTASGNAILKGHSSKAECSSRCRKSV